DTLTTDRIVRLGIAQSPEGRRIFPRMTVLENLELGAFARPDRAAIAPDLERVFTLFPRLHERVTQKGGTLSGGEQQMLAIGRALMARPTLLLLDEPSMGLSPILVDAIFRIIQEVNRQGTTILLVEQNARMALRVAHRGYVIQTGRIVLQDAAAELLRSDVVRGATSARSRRSAPERQAREVELGHAGGHEVGDDPGGAARHRPAHVAVAAVQEEVAMAAEPEDGRPVGRHGPETRAVLALVVVGGVGEQVAGEAQDVVEVARRPAPVVPGELGGGRQAEPVAEPRPADEPALVDAGDGRREPAPLQRKGRGVPLRGVDRETHARGAGDARATDAEREHVVVRGQRPLARQDRLDPVALPPKRRDTRAE